jgi:hypothetical protein
MPHTSTIIQYRVKAERAAENVAAIRAVFDELHRVRLKGVRYAVFVQADGVTFMHLVAFDSAQQGEAFSSLATFRAFREGVKARCETVPVVSAVSEITAYGAFNQ